MKHLWLFLILLISSFPCSAQELKGAISVGGGVSVYYTRTEYADKYLSLWINPKIGKYLTDRDVFGFSIWDNYYWNSVSYDSVTLHDRDHSFSFNPFWRRDFPTSDRFGFYIQCQSGLGFSKRRNEHPGGHITDKTIDFMARINPGLYYFITDRLAFEGVFGAASLNSTFMRINGEKGTRVDVDVSFGTTTFGIGLQYYFKK